MKKHNTVGVIFLVGLSLVLLFVYYGPNKDDSSPSDVDISKENDEKTISTNSGKGLTDNEKKLRAPFTSEGRNETLDKLLNTARVQANVEFSGVLEESMSTSSKRYSNL